MRPAFRPLVYAWAFPTTCVGLVAGGLTLATGGRVRAVAGILEFYGGFSKVMAHRCGFAAMTLGHVVVGFDSASLARCRDHELVHVRQVERWGPLFIPAYLIESCLAWRRGEHFYYDNRFEIQARRESGEL